VSNPSAFGPDVLPRSCDLDSVFSWRELRKCTKDLTLHYKRTLCLLADTPDNLRLVGKYLEFST